jgi:glycosyltransferase involved in cell wall biosynthesis
MGRILMILRPDEGGAFQHVTALSAGVAAAGHDVAICGLEALPREELEPWVDPAVEVIPLKMVRPITPAMDARGVAGLGRVFREWAPDVIHAHGSKEAALGRAARVARPRTPFAYTPHGYAFAKPWMSAGERRVYRLSERVLSPLATVVVCICEAERRLAMEVGPKSRTRVVHNGIAPPGPRDPDPFVRSLRERGPVVCALSGLRVGKGVETLIEAFGRVAERHPGASLVVAGEGPEGPALEALAAGLGLADSVRFLGEVDDVFTVLAAADLFVQPSWSESFPYAVLEAMAAGVPIVATDVGGTGEAIEDGRSAVLVPARDPGALASGISGMLGDPERRGELARAANLRFMERFTLERMVAGTVEIYSELGV